jgi:hypothetical protein
LRLLFVKNLFKFLCFMTTLKKTDNAVVQMNCPDGCFAAAAFRSMRIVVEYNENTDFRVLRTDVIAGSVEAGPADGRRPLFTVDVPNKIRTELGRMTCPWRRAVRLRNSLFVFTPW